MRIINFILVFIIFFMISCAEVKRKIVQKSTSKEEKETLEIKNVELAKAILWPQPVEFKIKRDPFEPLLWKGVQKEIKINPKFDLRLIGTLSLGEEVFALVEMPNKIGVFKKGESIGEYKVKDIKIKKVILEKNGETVILKIGGEG